MMEQNVIETISVIILVSFTLVTVFLATCIASNINEILDNVSKWIKRREMKKIIKKMDRSRSGKL